MPLPTSVHHPGIVLYNLAMPLPTSVHHPGIVCIINLCRCPPPSTTLASVCIIYLCPCPPLSTTLASVCIVYLYPWGHKTISANGRKCQLYSSCSCSPYIWLLYTVNFEQGHTLYNAVGWVSFNYSCSQQLLFIENWAQGPEKSKIVET